MRTTLMPLAAVSLALPILSGCAGAWTVDENVQRLNAVTPQGSIFTRGLTGEYRRFATFERDEMYDWSDADHFARKGLRAAAGSDVEPEQLADRNLPRDKRDELETARQRLIQALDNGGRSLSPVSAATAQGRFDCWMEQQEENHQPEHIAACRDAFWVALEDTERTVGLVGPRDMTRREARSREPHQVFFDFQSAELTPRARKALDAFIADTDISGPARIVIEGHTDRVGPSSYNSWLSEQRAEAVRRYLSDAGVLSERVNITERAYGETRPMVETADGVREPANRRAVIMIEE